MHVFEVIVQQMPSSYVKVMHFKEVSHMGKI